MEEGSYEQFKEEIGFWLFQNKTYFRPKPKCRSS